jgi:hypothetical protein
MPKAKPTVAPQAGEPSIAELIADAEKHAAQIDHPNADAASKAIVALVKFAKALASLAE